jgi:hypothetical protein
MPCQFNPPLLFDIFTEHHQTPVYLSILNHYFVASSLYCNPTRVTESVHFDVFSFSSEEIRYSCYLPFYVYFHIFVLFSILFYICLCSFLRSYLIVDFFFLLLSLFLFLFLLLFSFATSVSSSSSSPHLCVPLPSLLSTLSA